MSDKNYRIRTNVSKDDVVRVNLTQDVDFLEILSLKINQEDTYKLHVSNYGVIVGRVLANESFGIPNAKVSVFIELTDEDAKNSEFFNLYPYKTTRDKDEKGIRYNLLPDSSNDECQRVVGTFPNKRLVLDNDTEVEIFDKYWKYTTVTNKSGDYMIFGVPTGNQNVHVDIDLSDIGILSQKPIDFMYKGYNITQFDNARQFKESTNLDNLSQILSQDNSVHVYPFWGDKNLEEIAISRCDVQIQYKFESTCVFFGSIISDNFNNNIGHKCTPSKHAGFNRLLVTGEGTIEMIRKTPDKLVEEFQIQGNRLIDGDGVWCYQIPMNLDYVGTDEFGNIVPTDNVNKGIATRTSVRFRVSMQETNNEGVSRHRAKYLIPNVQNLVKGDGEDDVNKYFPHISNSKHFEDCYEFGSATPDEYFRDLYWNKVYSVKNYIPRIQTNGKKNTQNYSAIRTVNNNGNLNPVPFNHARFRLVFAYRVLCMIMTIVITIISILNAFLSSIVCLKILWVRPFKFMCRFLKCISISGGLTEDIEDNVEFFPGCKRSCGCMMKCEEKGCEKRTDKEELINVVQQTLSQEYDIVNLDFYNDWLNGSLYLPLWFWKKTKKKKFLFGLFHKKAVNTFCNCSKHYRKLRVTQNCALPYGGDDYLHKGDDRGKKYHYHFPAQPTGTYFGVIKEFENRDGLKIYYYAPGLPNVANYKTRLDKSPYVRLYSTDIILLGSLNSCDIDNYPNVFSNLPSTTANVPFIATIKEHNDDDKEEGYVEITGMDWLHKAEKSRPKYGAGLLMDLACNAVYTKPKSCINVERMSELGVTLDTHEEIPTPTSSYIKDVPREADGLITRYEIVDNETRAMFASLNNNGLQEKILNPNTGYYTYKLRYVYPNDFDGHLIKDAPNYTKMLRLKTYDAQDINYVDYRFGLPKLGQKFFYSSEGGNNYTFPIFNNSFYFYFGLNEGKTAIDKFNNKFYASCYKNNKFPFTVKISKEPGKWCKQNVNTDYGTIRIELEGIKLPFSYILYDEFNNEIIEENEMSIIELCFGYDVVKDGGAYLINNGKLVKNGELKYFKTGENVLDEFGEKMYLENQIYHLKIKDINGNSVTQVINLEQVGISLIYDVLDLGDKFYENITIKNDFCYDGSDKYGEINIDEVVIDGNNHDILGVETIGDGEYNLTLSDNEMVKFTIRHQDIEKYNIFEECHCNALLESPQIVNIDGTNILKFKIWIPGNYDISVNQYCKGELNDNIMNSTVKVNNGVPFNAYINEVPIRFLLGKNENILTEGYNPKLYDTNLSKILDGWFKLGYEITNTGAEGAYKFEPIVKESESVWEDFVPVLLNNDETFFDEDSINDIILYKYNCIFNLAKSCYIVDATDNSMTISHSGGRGIILFKGTYPQYDEAEDNRVPFEGEVDNIGSVTMEISFPNLVSYTYTDFLVDDNHPTYPENIDELLTLKLGKYRTDYNIFIERYKSQGNYFAAFTNNGCLSKVNNKLLPDCKYKQIPFMANPMATSFSQATSPALPYRKYFRGLFVDKRLDYTFLIFTPYGGNGIRYVTEDNSSDWMKGRMSGNTYNGIEMTYNNQTEYSIIGDNLEYNTIIDYVGDADNGNKVMVNEDVTSKRFYKTILKSGNNKFNIVDFMHGNEGNVNGLKFVTRTDGIITKDFDVYPMVRGFDVRNIPTSEKLTFTCSSCSYDAEVGLTETEESDDRFQKVTGITQEIGETEFKISSKIMIRNEIDNLNECAASNTYNVFFEASEDVTTGGGYVKFESKAFKANFRLLTDSVNDEHVQYTSPPYLFNVKSGGANNISKVKERITLDEIISELKDHTIGGPISYESQNNVHHIFKKNDYGVILNKGEISMSDKLALNFGKFVTDDDKILYDNTTDFKNIKFRCARPLIDLFGKGEILSIYFIRTYVNSSNDNLTKEISTIQFTSIYDIRYFELKCNKAEKIKINDVNTEVSITNPNDKPDGENEQKANEASGSTSTSATSETEVQYTQYEIRIKDDHKYNQEFYYCDNMSGAIRIDGKISTNITFEAKKTNDEVTSVLLNAYWSGDLAGIYLDGGKEIELFIQTSNKLIYKLKFNHKN